MSNKKISEFIKYLQSVITQEGDLYIKDYMNKEVMDFEDIVHITDFDEFVQIGR